MRLNDDIARADMDELKSDIWVRSPRETDATRSSLVIGETGGDWEAAIAIARLTTPNLSLVTQWVGESAVQFAQRVASRLSRRRGLSAVVLACNTQAEPQVLNARGDLLQRCAAAMNRNEDAELTLLCFPDSAESGSELTHRAPQWVHPLCGAVRTEPGFRLAVRVGNGAHGASGRTMAASIADKIHAA
jgi:hypothetical protein